MKFEKPSVLALGFAAITGLAVWLGGFLVLWITKTWYLSSAILVLGVAISLISYVLLRFAIENFIYRKVKIIYKNIHDLKIGNEKDEEEIIRTTNLDMVTQEVAEWAEQRNSEIEGLKEKEQFRREFLGNISHELKTPIFNIQGYLLTLLDGALDDPDINRKFLVRANKSVDRMINLVSDLEAISNLEALRVQLNPSNFNIVDLVRDVFELLEENAAKRKIKLVFNRDYEKPIRVEADRQKIEQVLINLINNAIKYGKENGKVEIRFYDMHHQVLTEIADNGLGIPQEDVPRIFERFYRVDKSRSRDAGGTGLGLAIVKHILEAHKQTINARSGEGVGSTFSFTLKKQK
mgnify:CR=1 FL=1